MTLFLILLINLILIAIPSAIAGGAGLILGQSFWVWSGLSFIGISLIGSLWTMLSTKITKSINTQNELLQKIQKQSEEVELYCAYCNARNVARLRMGYENTFICNNCNETNKVEITYSPIRITQPISVDKITQEIFRKIDLQQMSA